MGWMVAEGSGGEWSKGRRERQDQMLASASACSAVEMTATAAGTDRMAARKAPAVSSLITSRVLEAVGGALTSTPLSRVGTTLTEGLREVSDIAPAMPNHRVLAVTPRRRRVVARSN